MTNLIHTNNAYRNVGMIEVLNEPAQGYDNLVSTYYPTAYSKIRATEDGLGVTSNNYLHVQFMDRNWGSGDPNQGLSGTTFVAYDNHRYLKWDTSVPVTHQDYINTSCNDNPASDGETPLIVGEWSLSVPDNVQDTSDWEVEDDNNLDFYKQWYAAQITTYEKQLGWIFWAWKAQLGDLRWSYQDAVSRGVIPKDPTSALNSSPC